MLCWLSICKVNSLYIIFFSQKCLQSAVVCHMLPVSNQNDTCIWAVCKWKKAGNSHSFCLPVTLWSVLPFFLHFLLGNRFLGKFCGFLKTWYHVSLFITAQACVSRGFMWGQQRVMKLFVANKVVIGTVEMPFYPLQCVNFQRTQSVVKRDC